ncbi:LuxR C-terminal-related transcriptional regulator [Geodermatophilus sp. YIM 151500]|uniref:HD domain-containing phosphohydrolase n=1 Tax=Geodermatophilus sp. YIM 151500 TaxID=2984531 RepID=UPI0021E4AA37|nr:HD domain-containing phosphohydrolase [Geodermatophilus sp. YIM 151500]MCV2491071.1 LuxR C-terminal-related transcriptional regulator [Geodermatophilus sp. YIM 151500]
MPRVRLAEVCAALSLTTDLASGAPFEKGLRTCVVATAFAELLGADEADRTAVFYAALLRSLGCTAHASENAALFLDDVAFQAAFKRLDPGAPAVFDRQLRAFGAWAPAQQDGLRQRFLRLAPVDGPRAARACCEVSRALGGLLGLPVRAVDALDDVYERWDGLGLPGVRRGEELSWVARVVHVAEQAVFAHADGGVPAARAEVVRRAGGHLDPGLAAAFVSDAGDLLAALAAPDLLVAVVAAEPGPAPVVGPADRTALCRALAAVADLKGRWLLGHSGHVAAVADAGAVASGFPDAERPSVQAAALLHDLGRVTVSSAVWDRPGPLGAADRERVRLHAYWTDRILRRCPALADLAGPAAAHHERCDASGYHRGVGSTDLSRAARLLAAADVFAAVTEPRPYRGAGTPDSARAVLAAEVAAGRLDREACDAVLTGAGATPVRAAWPCGLTGREVDVVRLAARGRSDRAIAAQLGISPRTVGHHLAHVYDKTGRRTRAGVAVFAMEHGLLPGWAEPPMRTPGPPGHPRPATGT